MERERKTNENNKVELFRVSLWFGNNKQFYLCEIFYEFVLFRGIVSKINYENFTVFA